MVDGFRREHDPARRAGVMAHVTVLYPFVPRIDLQAALEAEISGIVSSFPAFDVSFTETRRFPDVVWLAPDPDAPFRSMTAALVGRWPEHLPYRGAFGDDPVPHLTLGHAAGDVAEQIETEIAGRLPLVGSARRVELIELLDGRWRVRRVFPFSRGS